MPSDAVRNEAQIPASSKVEPQAAPSPLPQGRRLARVTLWTVVRRDLKTNESKPWQICEKEDVAKRSAEAFNKQEEGRLLREFEYTVHAAIYDEPAGSR